MRMRVCTPCGAGVCVCACRVCAWGWCRQRETQPGAKDDAVCVCVCVCVCTLDHHSGCVSVLPCTASHGPHQPCRKLLSCLPPALQMEHPSRPGHRGHGLPLPHNLLLCEHAPAALMEPTIRQEGKRMYPIN